MTVTPAKYNDFVIYQGATFSETLIFTDSEENIFDLNNFQVSMKIRKSYQLQTTIELSTENGKITLNIPRGSIAVEIPATTTKTLKPGNYIYNLELKNGDIVDRYLQGSIFISPEVK